MDISWWKNHPEWTSIFCWNYEDDFVGGYDHGKEAGILLLSNHHIAPGKKFWTWSTGPRGQLWDKALTETDGPELELMTGGYSDTQPDYSWLHPYESKFLKQYFYPIRGIGSVKHANLEAAVNLEKTEENRIRIGLNTTSKRDQATVLLSSDNEILFTEQIDIDPANPFSREVTIPEGINETDLKISLHTSKGKELISYSPAELKITEMPEVAVPPVPPEEIKTVEELYMTGLRLEQFYNPSFDPKPYYAEALHRDPDDYRVNNALGLMKLRNGLFEQSEAHLQKAVARITHNYTKARNGEAFYYLGLCQQYMGKNDEAYKNFYLATWSQAYHSAAYYQLAELACMKQDYDEAYEHLNRSLSTNAHHSRASNLKAALLRIKNRNEKALILSAGTREFDPLDFWSLCEAYFCLDGMGNTGESEQALRVLRTGMRDYEQSYLELSMDYAGAGLWNEAIRVLDEVYLEGDNDRDAYPMVYYFLGYFWLQKGDETKALDYFERASDQSPDYCFPFRLESIKILEEAARVNPSDPMAPYYLGNLFFDMQPGRAIKQWERSVALDDSFWLNNRNLGMAYSKVDHNIPLAVKHYLRAISLKPDDQRLLYEVDLIYAAGREDSETRLKLLQDHHDVIAHNNVSDALSREVMLLVQLKRYEEALKVLGDNYFKQWEGVSKAYNSYVDAHLFTGWNLMHEGDFKGALEHMKTAREFPDNMMVAEPYRGGRSGQVHYLTGEVFEELGKTDLAREQFQLCVEERQHSGLNENYFYRALSLKKLGYGEKAQEIFDGLISLGEARLHSTEADFFAKFGEKETPDDKLSNAYYLLGLGYMGKQMDGEAEKMFTEAVRLNINHVWAAKYLSEIQK